MRDIQFAFRDCYGQPRGAESKNRIMIHNGIVVRSDAVVRITNPFVGAYIIYPYFEPGSKLSTIHKMFKLDMSVGSLAWYDYIINNRCPIISANSWEHPHFSLQESYAYFL